MQNKLLSIVVPSYNAEKYLLDTMPTILKSKYIDLIDLMIVNDGSSDKTEEIAKELKNNFPNCVRIFNKSNGGHGSTINVGISHAIGKYFKIIDADDWVDTNNFDILMEQLQRNDSDMIVTPYYQVFIENNNIKEEKEYNEFEKLKINKVYLADEFFEILNQTVGMHTITIKTKILQDNNIKLSEKMFYVDMEFITYILPHINNVQYLENPVYKYRLGTQGQSVSIESYKKNRKMHENVILNLIDFYTAAEMSNIKKEILQNLIFNLIRKQWKIYLSLDNNIDSKQELIQFENRILNKNSQFMNDNQNLKIKIIRMSKYNLFNLAKSVYNWRKK